MKMFDSPTNKPEQNASLEAPSTIEKASMQLSLLALSAKDGFSKDVQTALDDKVTFGAKFAGVAALGAAVTRATVLSPTAARYAVPAMTTLFAVDVISRAAKTAVAMGDTWSNPENYESNKRALEPVIGGGIFDYGVYGLAAGIGVRQVHSRLDDQALANRMSKLWHNLPESSTPIFRNTLKVPTPTQIHSQTAPEAQFYSHHRPSVVQVENQMGRASGFFVDKNLVATNYHVVQGSRQLRVIDHANNNMRATFVSRDAAADLALIRVERMPPEITPRVVQIGNTDELTAGSKVLNIGHPLNTPRPPLGEGTFSKPEPRKFGDRTISDVMVNLPTRSGSSGSPIFDESGKVVSVVSRGTGHEVLGAHSSHLKALIEATKPHIDLPPRHWLNVRSSASGDIAKGEPTTITTVANVRNRYDLADHFHGLSRMAWMNFLAKDASDRLGGLARFVSTRPAPGIQLAGATSFIERKVNPK